MDERVRLRRPSPRGLNWSPNDKYYSRTSGASHSGLLSTRVMRAGAPCSNGGAPRRPSLESRGKFPALSPSVFGTLAHPSPTLRLSPEGRFSASLNIPWRVRSPRTDSAILAIGWPSTLRFGARAPLATLSTDSGPTLKRFYGSWSSRYHRFTTNLSSAQVLVRPVEPGQAPGDGVRCILHWVKQEDTVRIDRGGVCQGDGWPVDLWRSFTATLRELRGRSIAERLRAYLHSDWDEDVPIVAEWRRLLQAKSPEGGPEALRIGSGWIPVPAKLERSSGASACILSWSPSSFRFDSLQEALESGYARRESVDLANQVKYYLECVLARLHRVTFGPNDSIEDREFERSAAFLELEDSFTDLEARRIVDPALGPLDRFG